jgi:hypothetical protein
MESREFTEARNDPGKTKPVARTGRDVSGKAYHSIDPKTAAVVSRKRSNAEPTTNDARTRKDVGSKRRTEGGLYGRHSPPAGRVYKDERDK